MNMKKLISMVLALLMLLAMSTTAMAEDSNGFTITINHDNAADKHIYEAYQLFTGDLSGKILSNIQWGSGVTDDGKDKLETEYEVNSAAALADKLGDEADAKAFAAAVAEYLTDVKVKSETEDNKTYTINVTEPGYYLIKDQDNSITGYDSYTRYIIKVVKDTTAQHKGEVPKVDKEIVEEKENVKVNEASIGDTVEYELTATLPSNYSEYDTYKLVFHDKLSDGLTFTAGRVEVFYKNGDTETPIESFTVDADGCGSDECGCNLTVTIADLTAIEEIQYSTEIIVRYEAVLNENAVIGGTVGNKNEVKLEYSNDPNYKVDPNKPGDEGPTGVTPPNEVTTFVTELTINKIDGKTEAPLAGVEFTLTTEDGAKIVLVSEETFVASENGTYYKLNDGTYTETAPTDATASEYADVNTKYERKTTVLKGKDQAESSIVGTVDANGKLTFTGLGAGTYTLTETKTPAGYNTIVPITFTIEFDPEKKEFSSTNNDIQVESDNTLFTTIENNQGATLPETGAQGTKMIYIVGGILVAAAAILLITKRRMNAAE